MNIEQIQREIIKYRDEIPRHQLELDSKAAVLSSTVGDSRNVIIDQVGPSLHFSLLLFKLEARASHRYTTISN